MLVEALPYGDKFGHAGLWGAMTLILNLAVRRWFGVPIGGSRRLLVPVASVALCVWFLLKKPASCSWTIARLIALDLAADVVGITLGSVMFRMLSSPPPKN